MNPFKRLWQWYREWRVERQALKGHAIGGQNPAHGAPPLTGSAEDPRLRLRKMDPGPRLH
jgi:hypothetical protein